MKKNIRTIICSQILKSYDESFAVMIQIRNQLKVQCSGLSSGDIFLGFKVGILNFSIEVEKFRIKIIFHFCQVEHRNISTRYGLIFRAFFRVHSSLVEKSVEQCHGSLIIYYDLTKNQFDIVFLYFVLFCLPVIFQTISNLRVY